MGSYLRPDTVADALQALATTPRVVLAGGTDYFPARVARPVDDDILDISGLAELRGFEDRGDDIRIGALTTWTDAVRAALPPWLEGLKQAARAVGGIQVQNAGTIAGNLCNASPAADGIPNLLACDAVVELSSLAGIRRLPVDMFVRGNRQTARRPDELVTAILLPKPPRPAHGSFLKLGARRYLVISIVMVAAVAEIAAGRIAALRVAVGSCSAVACRLPALEQALVGRAATAATAELATAAHLAPLAPIDDVRGTAVYRRDAALTLVRRAVAAVIG